MRASLLAVIGGDKYPRPQLQLRDAADRRTGFQARGVGSRIAPRVDLEAYLLDVSYSEIEEIDFEDYRKDRVWTTEYDDHIGPNAPAPPGDQTFWRASVSGEGTQDLIWEIEPGDWSLVVMNADGLRGIDVTGSVGAEAPWLLAVGIGVLATGVVLLAIGLALVLLVARRSRTVEPREMAEVPPATPSGFPLTFKASPPRTTRGC